ncbi:hypothetical protein [Bacillus kwashiorkori]|uniref:hypothetical protein n=1 Tax=Bacillus kwashiorkori TaxID=1522318 RepID=UPI000783D591|nr:hypothetical protein [Bacillus kwashiorkori]
MKKFPFFFLLVAIIILLSSTAFLSFRYSEEKQANQRHWEVFVNHFYFSLDKTINYFDRLITEQPQADELDILASQLQVQLLLTDQLLADGRYFHNDEILTTTFFKELTDIVSGINSDSITTKALSEDNMLDENEIALLENVRNILTNAREKMYSSETEQEKNDLSVKELNEIISQHFRYSSIEIYSQTPK